MRPVVLATDPGRTAGATSRPEEAASQEAPQRARQDLNLRPRAPEARALTPELRARGVPYSQDLTGAYRSDRGHLGHAPAARKAPAPGRLHRSAPARRSDPPRRRPDDD